MAQSAKGTGLLEFWSSLLVCHATTQLDQRSPHSSQDLVIILGALEDHSQSEQNSGIHHHGHSNIGAGVVPGSAEE